MATEILMTEEGFEELKRELEDLKTVKRSEISEKIRVARGFGDLSENSEYDEAKNEQAIMEARILEVEEKIKSAKILKADQLSTDLVSIGSIVKLLDIEYNDELEYRVVSAAEPNKGADSITDESPVGKALMGHKVGEEVVVAAPGGNVSFRILSIGK